ncbi:unnamed protein product [Ilex paraguariensis]|uniref:Uncharacterized protein n=1 Tax=Ilex paraguariensis TaxID=185542 RepID=A0ABC8RL92_9AQUA
MSWVFSANVCANSGEVAAMVRETFANAFTNEMLSNDETSHKNAIIIIVIVAFGGLFFLAFLLIALCCFGKKIWKKKKTIQETDIVRVDEHMRIKEAAVQGPHGAEAVVLSMEDDVHVEEEIRKNEKVGAGTHAKSAEITPKALEEGESSSISGHKHPEHKL